MFAGLGVERGAADVLDELALLVAAQEPVRCARLAAAASVARDRLSCAALPETRRRLDAARRQILEQGEAEMWDRGWMEGATMSLNDAVNSARRTRGPRSYSGAGKRSLSPIETEVAELVAVGLSNPEIAAKLYISRGTVKMHLSSVYTKLGLANRVELALAAKATSWAELSRN